MTKEGKKFCLKMGNFWNYI